VPAVKYARILDLPGLLAKKSCFLFGPRATGKSYLIREHLASRAIVIDLLRSDLFLRLSANPADLESLVGAKRGPSTWVVIDEVQKIPELLDEVHRLIEGRRIRFLLTGSSARKLRRGRANLLAGRAWQASLFALVWPEIPNFDLSRHLRWGGLPSVVPSDDPDEELAAYTRTYLHEEILAEGLVRRLPPFARFLTVAALANGQMVNFEQIASDAAVPASTVREYVAILEDTLIGFLLEPWTGSRRRKAIATAKLYLFDTGVTHAIAGTRAVDRNSDLWGRSFEQWVGLELRAYLAYRRRPDRLAYWRSTHGHEVDFVVGDHTAIAVKATRRVSPRDLRGLRALAEERAFRSHILVSDDSTEAIREGVRRLPWKKFVRELWGDQLLPG
jgi:predicted AAA+ superfamily ATPase